MEESLQDAAEEVKRAEHLFYVSLKYTRTADMMRHTIERLINAFSFGVESLLKHAKEEKKIDEIPANPVMRCKLLLKNFTDEELTNYVDLYSKLRKIIKVDYSKREEYRRHVTMSSVMENGEIVEVNIDVLKDYYDLAKNFIKYAERIIEGKEEE